MLSDEYIDNIVRQITQRQQNINIYVISVIAERIKRIGELLPSDVRQLERLYRTGSDVQLINAEIAKQTALQVQDIKSIIREVAESAYVDAKPYFDYRKKSFISFEKNKEMQRIVTAISNQTANTYTNISKAQAFMFRDMKNPQKLIPTPTSEAYQSVIDEAVQASATGVIDYNTAIRRSMTQLIDSGLRRITYQAESGRVHTQRMDTAVRRNVLDGIRAINQGVQDEVGKEFGANGIELTVHNHPAPDHAPVQGHQFTNAEFEKMQDGRACTDVNGNSFAGFPRAIGTLNCKHFAYSIIIGAMKPTYSERQLKDILNENEKGYTTATGKHLTMYQCEQEQNRLETEVRKAKEGQMTAKKSGDMVLAQKYEAKVWDYVKKYQAFSKACGLPIRGKDLYVKGYKELK